MTAETTSIGSNVYWSGFRLALVLALNSLCISLAVAQTGVKTEAFFTAGYELALSVGGDEWSVRTQGQVRAGQTLEHRFGDYLLVMKLARGGADGYVVEFTVTDTDNDVVVPGGILSETLAVAEKSITEFSLQSEWALVSGAIAISVLNR